MADRVLDAAAGFWYLIMLAGQAVFVVYLLSFYGLTAAQGDFTAWNQVLPKGRERQVATPWPPPWSP